MAFRSSRTNRVRLPFGRRTVAFGSNVAFFGSKFVRNNSTWLYPSAQKILDAMTIAAVSPSGYSGESKVMNHVSPLASNAVNPGWAPALFSLINTHFDASGGAPRTG